MASDLQRQIEVLRAQRVRLRKHLQFLRSTPSPDPLERRRQIEAAYLALQATEPEWNNLVRQQNLQDDVKRLKRQLPVVTLKSKPGTVRTVAVSKSGDSFGKCVVCKQPIKSGEPWAQTLIYGVQCLLHAGCSDDFASWLGKRMAVRG